MLRKAAGRLVKGRDEDDTVVVEVGAQAKVVVPVKVVVRGVEREPGESPATFPLPRRQRPQKKRAANSNGSSRRRVVSRDP